MGTVEERSGELSRSRSLSLSDLELSRSLSLSTSPSCSEEAPVPAAPEELSFTHSLWKLTLLETPVECPWHPGQYSPPASELHEAVVVLGLCRDRGRL